MAIIDAGIFVILLATAFGSLFMSNVVRQGYVFKLVGAFLFFALGIMMNAEYDVAYTVVTTDAEGNQSTDIRYIVGGSAESQYHAWLGWLFVGFGLAWVALFFMDVMSGRLI